MRSGCKLLLLALLQGLLLLTTPLFGQQTLSIPPDSPRWELEQNAKVADYQGRQSLMLDGGAATLKDFEMRDGVIDVDIATPGQARLFWHSVSHRKRRC